MANTRRSYSIRTALLAWLLPMATVFMAVAWVVHGQLLERMADSFVQSRLTEEADFLEAQILRGGATEAVFLEAGSYLEQVFHHAFALGLGNVRIVFPEAWEVVLLPLLDHSRAGFISTTAVLGNGAAESSLLVYRRELSVAEGTAVILVAEDLTAHQHGQQALHWWTGLASLALLVMLVVMIWLAITFSLRPVPRLQQSLRALQQGEQQRLAENHPSEFVPLIRQLNYLLDTLEQRLERSRAALANLSHSIKTPLAAVRQVLDSSDTELTPALRQQLLDRLLQIDQQLEAEMRRSRFAGPGAGQAVYPVAVARDLVWMLGRLHQDKHFELVTPLDEGQRWPLEQEDFSEILGNLLDNAGKWAQQQVLLELCAEGDVLIIRVSDDGPGVADDLLQHLGNRGLRLDQQTHGHGLGLAIARDLVSRYQGALLFSASPLGGLRAEVSIPNPASQSARKGSRN